MVTPRGWTGHGSCGRFQTPHVYRVSLRTLRLCVKQIFVSFRQLAHDVQVPVPARRYRKKMSRRGAEILARASPANQHMEKIEDGALGAGKSSQKNNTLDVC